MPSYMQTTSAECGLACLGYIAAYFGAELEMSEIRAKFFVSSRGASLGDLVRVAGKLGLNARPLRLELGGLKKLSTPCVLHWDLDHFVVLLSIKNNKVKIFDPSRGLKIFKLEDVSSHFTGFALEISASEAFEKKSAKPSVHWNQLTGKIVGLKRNFSQLFILAASLQIILIISPLFMQWIIDGAVVSGDLNFLVVMAIGLSLATVIKVLLEVVRGWVGIVTSVELGTQWGARVMNHLLRLPVQWFETRHSGDVISRFQSLQSIQQTVTGKLVETLLDGAFALITLGVMFMYSAKLAFIAVFAVVCYAAIRVLPHGAFHRAMDETMIYESRAQSHFLESMRAMQVIKLAGLEEFRSTRWQNLIIESTNRKTVTQKMGLTFSAGYSLVNGFESIAVLYIGAQMAIQGALSVGMLMAFIAYKNEFANRTQNFIDNLMAMRMLKLHLERLSDIVLSEKEVVDGVMPQGANLPRYNIFLENVSYRYHDGGAWILRNIFLEIKAGENVAIVGATGCGKTTIVKLILGLLMPTNGRILIGGLPLEQLGLTNWRQRVGTVMQDDQLFSGSLLENIASFDEHIDLERVHHSASLAAIHEDILVMPMGYNTLVGDMGNSLSGGQKQRILLARALYRRPQVLLLDEATSHLDVSKERQVNLAIRSLNITRITIAHRPETISMADQVIDISKLSRFEDIAVSA